MVQEAALDPSKHSALCVATYRFAVVTNISLALLMPAQEVSDCCKSPCFHLPPLLFSYAHMSLTISPLSFLPYILFFSSAHGSIRHHGTVWSLSDFSYNGCCDHVSMGIANCLLRRSWRYFQPLSHCCYKGTEPQKRPRNLSCSGAWKELLQRWHLMDLSLDYKSRLLPPWLMKSCFKEKMRKQWKLWLLCWGQEGWSKPRQKGSSQEPDLMAGKHIGLWQLRRKKFFSPSVF